jgi:ketosteroid isomerase-like protein
MQVEPGTNPEAAGRGTVVEFNDAITRRDLAILGSLMTDDHTFVDSSGNVISGKEVVLEAWRRFFEAFPDYRNVWTQLVRGGDGLIAIGRSVCASQPELDGPAIWAANVRGNKVSEWRVYEDTPSNRTRLGLDDR